MTPESAPDLRSLLHPTIYCEEVFAGKHVVNAGVRTACERHMHDLGRDDIYFCQDEFDRFESFVSTLVVADGHELTGQRMVMLPWQSFFLASILCWKIKETGGIRYKQAAAEVARGAGKSTMMGVLMLYVTRYWEGSDNVCLANRVDQARQAYDAAGKIAIRAFGSWRSEDAEEAESALYETTFRETRCRESGGRFRPMASTASGMDGLKCICYVCDEGAESKEDYFEKVISALPKLRDSFMVSVTTPGSPETGQDSPYYKRRRLFEEALDPDIWKSDRPLEVFSLFYGIEEDDDCEDPEVWQKAQPSLGHVIPVSQYERLLQEYKAQDAMHNWERYQCCIYSLIGLPWIDLKQWHAQEFQRPTPELPEDDRPVFAACDFSKSMDLTSLAWGYWGDEGKFQMFWHHWVIEDEGFNSNHRHYKKYVDEWDRYPYVTKCTNRVSYELVRARIQTLMPNLVRCGYDSMGGMKTEVQAWGDRETNYSPNRGDLPMWSVPQTIVSMGPATYLLEGMLRNDQIQFQKDAIVEYALPNVQLQENMNGDRRPCKKSSMGIIDPIVAAICLGCVLIQEGAERPGAYADIGDIVC